MSNYILLGITLYSDDDISLHSTLPASMVYTPYLSGPTDCGPSNAGAMLVSLFMLSCL